MNSQFNRISENVLFSVLIAAVVGWSALTVAADAAAPAASAAPCPVAKIAPGTGNS
jgi:hypothetical protein